MVVASVEPFLKGETGRNTRGLLRLIILCTIAGAAVASRLFSVIRKLAPLDLSLDKMVFISLKEGDIMMDDG